MLAIPIMYKNLSLLGFNILLYRYNNLKLSLITIYLIDIQIVSTYISKMLLKK